MKMLFTLIFGLLTVNAQAQEHHSQASLVMDHESFMSGMKIGLHLEIEPGWHAYWENPGDVGAPPKFNIQTSSIKIQESELMFPIPTRITGNPYDTYGFENEALFYKTIQFQEQESVSPVQLQIDAEWLICKEICVPCTKSFTIDLPFKTTKKDSSHFNAFSFPKVVPNIQASVAFNDAETILTIQANELNSAKEADFFPSLKMTNIFNKPITQTLNGNTLTLTYASTRLKEATVEGLLKLDSKTAYWVGKTEVVAETPPTKTKLSMMYVLLLAFLGGIILNLMPCVLPVVSLKVLSLLKTDHHHAGTIRRSNLWFSAGICVSLVLFSFVFLSVQQAGQKLGWGFQLQSPVFVSFLAILFFLIGLNLIGYFEIQSIPLPGLGKVFQKQSASSDFLAGFFTTLIATPCTAPFMAVAVGYALSQNDWTVVVTFAALGVGLSFPYLLLAAWPKLGKLFPKPGAWMITLKEFLSFPMFLTVVWLVWLLAQLTSSQSTIYILTALSLIIFFNWVQKKLFQKNPMNKNILLLLIAGGIFVLVLSIIQKKSDELIQWEPFDTQKIESYAKDSMVFVDFTADWCLTCKTNERLTFSNADVIKAIQDQKIKMIKADWTRQNPQITEILRKYDRAGVPFYLLYKPGLTTPQVLPTLLTPSIFITAITKGVTQ